MNSITKQQLLGIAVSVLTVTAHAQEPKFDCPFDWNAMTNLSGLGPGGLDRPINGLRVRDWKPEHLDLALRRHDECQASAPGPESLKKAERDFAVSRVAMYKGYLRQRDGQLAQEAAGKQAQAAVQQSGSAQVQTDSNRRLQLTYTDERGSTSSVDCVDASRIHSPWARLARQSQEDLPRFFQACVQAAQLPQPEAVQFKQRLDELQRDRLAGKEFVAAVQVLARSPQQQTDKTVGALEAQWRFNQHSDSDLRSAGQQLSQIRKAVDLKECDAHTKRTGLAENLTSAFYLMEFNQPTPLRWMICAAGRQNVKFSYSGGGLVGDESLDFKGQRTHVRIAVQRQKMPDGSILFVPVESRVNGEEKRTTTRANIQLLAHQLRTVLNNE